MAPRWLSVMPLAFIGSYTFATDGAQSQNRITGSYNSRLMGAHRDTFNDSGVLNYNYSSRDSYTTSRSYNDLDVARGLLIDRDFSLERLERLDRLEERLDRLDRSLTASGDGPRK
jgi:hypothetical protein